MNWRRNKNDGTFQVALERAKTLFIERAEAEMWRLFFGYEKPVYQNGRLVGTLPEHDTVAGIFMLKGACPEKYRERFEHTGAGGGPIRHDVDLSRLPLEQLRQMREWMLAAQKAPSTPESVTP